MAVHPSLMLVQLAACVVSARVVVLARLMRPTPVLVASPLLQSMLTLPLALCGSHLQSLLCQGVPSARGAGGIAGHTGESRRSSPASHTS